MHEYISPVVALIRDIEAQGYTVEVDIHHVGHDASGMWAYGSIVVRLPGLSEGGRRYAGSDERILGWEAWLRPVRQMLVQDHILPGGGPGFDPWGRERP